MKISARLANPATDKDGNMVAGSDRTVEVQYEGIGGNLDEARTVNGDDVVYSRYASAAVIDVQSLIRRGIKGGKNNEQIQADVTAFKLGVKQVTRKDPKEKALDALNVLSPEERKALLAEYAKSLKGSNKAA